MKPWCTEWTLIRRQDLRPVHGYGATQEAAVLTASIHLCYLAHIERKKAE